MAEKKNVKKKKNNSKAALALILVLLLALIVLFVVLLGDKDDGSDSTTTTTPATTQAQEPEQTGNINPLTGMSGFEAEGKRPIAVVVNNSKPARPQWGLCTPDIVVEGLTEAGVTRMLWLYADVADMPDKIGSLRSARHDFIEIAEGLDALFVHWGGSKYAYNAIESRNVDHFDGLRYANIYFFRDTERTDVPIEHRGYTTREAVEKGLDKLGLRREINSSYASPFAFASAKNPRTPAGGACTKLDIVFSNYCNHTFKYNTADSLYYNNINGVAMNDADGNQMAVKNVIILYCGISSKGDTAGCIEMDLTGGSGVLVSNGAYENITWKKGSSSSMLRLYSENGEELELNAGKSYIGLVPTAYQNSTAITG